MSEESAPPDLVERARAFVDAFSDRDLEAVMSYVMPDAVWDLSAAGAETCTGAVAIRAFVEAWFGAYEELLVTEEELLELGNQVVFVAYSEHGRLVGSDAYVEQRAAQVVVFDGGSVSRMAGYLDIDEARAAAGRLAEERGSATSENLELVRSIYADWERGDFTNAEWADPEIEYVVTDGPHPGRWIGIVAMADAFFDELQVWDGFRAKATGFRELDAERVLALVQFRASGKTSAIEVGRESAEIFHVRDAKVTRMVVYWDRDRAFADLGLKE